MKSEALYMCYHINKYMTNLTLAIPEKLHEKMKQFSEIRWSEVARRAIEKKIEDLEVLNKIASKSKLTEKDVEELSERINKNATKKFLS